MEQRLPELNPQPNSPETEYPLASLREADETVQTDPSSAEDEGFDAGEYVRQLIARMETDDRPATSSTPNPAKPPVDTPMAKLAPPKATAVPVSPLPLADAPSSLGEIVRQKDNSSIDDPTRLRGGQRHTVDLKKLREAANITTNSALHTFDCKSLIRRGYCQLAVAVSGMVVSLILLSMSDEARSLAYESSVVMVVISAIATVRFVLTSRLLNVKLRPSR